MTELVLGTVQFGLDYGVTNQAGELSDAAVRGILAQAAQSGIQLLDTAADYGSSQSRLGSVGAARDFQFVTKFSLPAVGVQLTPELLHRNSMQTLQAERLAGVLFHKPSDFADPRCLEAVALLRAGRDAGEIERIGVSVYSPAELEAALEVFPDLSLVQVPANVLDFSLLESDLMTELRSRGVHVHVRSVFLQGLLLADPAQLPAFFTPIVPALEQLRALAATTGRSVLELVLGKMRTHPAVDAVVFGATTADELADVTHAWELAATVADYALPEVPRELLDPRQWPSVRLSS